ncbi:MAG: DUF4105 domain-containing protein [Bacteroidetes bacterium]|nr:DUF4105 domain-containing protein [Bacteroidota bacterium]
MKKLLALSAFLFIHVFAFSQKTADSSHLRISLITCGPGEDLYSIFGHTGIRVTDSALQTDVVFNYGTFDDSDPYFYLKFTRGIMRYSLSVWPYNVFLEEYVAEQRSVSEQVLHLTQRQKETLYRRLQVNAQEEHRYYDYKFHQDNCTTRAKNMIAQAGPVHFGNILPANPPTYRNLIHNSLDSGGQYWNKLAIDLLLGAHLDAKVTNEQAMFLPAYLEKGFDSAFIDSSRLVSAKLPILAAGPKPVSTQGFTPVFVFTALFIIITALSFVQLPGAQKVVLLFDRILFFCTGLLGIVLWLVWLTRVDNVCSNNWNTLWALPTHAVMAFKLTNKSTGARIYWIITSLLLALLLIGWKWLPQEMNIALLPLVGLLLLRSLARLKKQ